MKTLLAIAMTIGMLALSVGALVAQSGNDLFQQALVKERTDGNMQAAIGLYQTIVQKYAADRALVAKALVQMALCYEKLDRNAAVGVYERVVGEFVDQTASVAAARTRLTALAQPEREEASSRRVVREVWANAATGPAATSPDGRYLAFRSSDNAVYVRDFSTNVTRRLTPPPSPGDVGRPNGRFAFSPDGRLIAYGWQERSGGRPNMRVVSLTGVASRIPYRPDEWDAVSPWGDWSADGTKILALAVPPLPAGVRHTRRIVLVSTADGTIEHLKTLPWEVNPVRLSLSADGRFVVYDYPSKESSPERDIFMLDAKSGSEVRLVARDDNDQNPFFTPDGTGVVFFSRRAGTTADNAMWFQRLAAGRAQGAPELLDAAHGSDDAPLGFARNGSFYYRHSFGMAESVVADVDPMSGSVVGQPATVTRRLVTGASVWSPDGMFVAYPSRRPSAQGETHVVVIRSISTGAESEVATTFGAGFDLGGWSPDGRLLLVAGFDPEKGAGIFQLDPRSGDLTLLLNDPGDGYLADPFWPANGQAIVFMRVDGAGRRIILRAVETGHEIELYRASPVTPIGCLAVSPDGQRLAFCRQDLESRTWVVMTMTIDGKDVRELGPPLGEPEAIGDILGLTPDGKHVWFTTRNLADVESARRYFSVAVDDGVRKELDLPFQGYVERVSFHPGGLRIVFTTYSTRAVVSVMENVLSRTGAAR